MELNLYTVRLNGGIMYQILSKATDSIPFIQTIARSNVFSIEKTGNQSKYLFFEHIVEVQKVEITQAQKDTAWLLKER